MVNPVAVLDGNPVYLGLVIGKFMLKVGELVGVNGNINGYIFLQVEVEEQGKCGSAVYRYKCGVIEVEGIALKFMV